MTTLQSHPIHPVMDLVTNYFGLTKREYFAVMILQGLAANQGPNATYKGTAEEAVKTADLLIESLNEIKY